LTFAALLRPNKVEVIFDKLNPLSPRLHPEQAQSCGMGDEDDVAIDDLAGFHRPRRCVHCIPALAWRPRLRESR
jgi:hypothetical protein